MSQVTAISSVIWSPHRHLGFTLPAWEIAAASCTLRPPAKVMQRLPSRDVTALLLAWGEGDESALARLIPIVHDELHRIARACMAGEKGDHTLQATALVNEAYLRLIQIDCMRWQNRAHFLAMAARLMRRILVDFARSKRYVKRGGGVVSVSLASDIAVPAEPGRDLVALDDALDALARIDPRKSRVIEMRFFGGLSVKETSEALGVSSETVMRDWKLAKAWLLRELRGVDASAHEPGARQP
jgi:RNA polymerase sigma-70 factor (ECF subfamily)